MRKKNSSNRAPSFSVIHVALLILCAVMITTHLTGGLNARYVSSAEGSDSARVAKFDVSVTKDSEVPFGIELEFLNPEKHQDQIVFFVSSNSEVAVKYDIIVVLPETIAGWVNKGMITVQLGENGPKSVNNGTLTFAGGTIDTGKGDLIKHTLTFTVSGDVMPSEQDVVTDSAILRIHFEQID